MASFAKELAIFYFKKVVADLDHPTIIADDVIPMRGYFRDFGIPIWM